MLKVKVGKKVVVCERPRGRGRKLWGRKLTAAQLRQLRLGIPVEAEHGVRPPRACGIALDHIAEFPKARYYTELLKLERRLKRLVKRRKA